MQKSKTLKISVYSFILTVLVIFVHAFNTEGMREGAPLLGLAVRTEYFFSDFLGQLAVPGFFMLSGYLFFRNGGPERGKEIPFFLGKWRRRVETLLYPYLLWNALYLLFHLIYKGVPADLAAGLFLYGCAPHLWFLWQLMLLTLFTPLVWLMGRSKGPGLCFWLLTLLAAVFYARIPFHLFNEDAFFYYYTGAFLALCFRKDAERGGGTLLLSAIAALLVSFLFARIPLKAAVLLPVLCFRFGGALLLWMWVMRFVPEGGKAPFFGEQRLFIYAYHYLPVRVISLAALSVTKGAPLALLGVYLLMPAAVCLTGLLVYRVLDRRFPVLLQLLGGGR